MTRSSWKRHALAASFAVPVLAAGGAALAQPKPHPPAAAPGDPAKAKEYFVRGNDLFKAKKFIPAMEMFKLSYATVPSPNSHLYIARCLAAIGETRAAHLEFDKVYDEAAARALTEEKYVPTRDSAKVERDELAGKLGLISVTVLHADQGTVLRLGPHEVPRDRWGRPYPVEPGTFEATLATPGRPIVKQTVLVGPGDRRAFNLDVAAGPAAIAVVPGPGPATTSKANPLRIGGIVAAAVGVAGFGMFAGAGVVSQSTYTSLKLKCGGDTGGCHGLNVSDEISKGKTQQAIANAGLVIGIAGIAAGATLIVLSTRPKKDAGRPTADLVVGPSWLGVQGEF